MVRLVERGIKGNDEIGDRVVIFCHFDYHGRVREHTRAYLRALHAEGLDLVFISNSGHLRKDDIEWVKTIATFVIVRRNIGYDFAAWRDALRVCALPAEKTSLLLLANDSVYGPLYPLGPVLDRLIFGQCDIWGITDSWQHRYHLQTYFLAFGRKALSDPAFHRFWRKIANVRSKWWVILNYEVGFTQNMLKAGLRCEALWPYVELVASAIDHSEMEETDPVLIERDREQLDYSEPCVARNGHGQAYFKRMRTAATAYILGAAVSRVPLNPTSDMWQELLNRQMPFIKRELIRLNPTSVSDAATWFVKMGQISSLHLKLILLDLQVTLRNRAP